MPGIEVLDFRLLSVKQYFLSLFILHDFSVNNNSNTILNERNILNILIFYIIHRFDPKNFHFICLFLNIVKPFFFLSI
jgi:hypothetical protein